MEYTVVDECIGSPSLKLDGESNDQIDQISFIISNLTNIEISKVVFFIKNFGIDKILNKPSIMGITANQEQALLKLKDLILFGDDTNGAINNVEPVQY